LRPVSWSPDTPAQRSREEAKQIALRLAGQAAEHPETFEDLARQYSDDDVTRSSGGSLGGLRATQLPDVFVDALSTLYPGGVSRPVETAMGFHILLRRSPPPHEEVEGRRIVVRYTGTLGSVDEGPSARPREEARALADSLAAKARDGSTPFVSLVSEYSEHADRVQGGDLGLWSTLTPGDKPREVETLARLKLGEVGPPLDSLWGFQVLQRIKTSTHGRYAMAAIRLQYGPLLPPEDPHSRPRVFERAQRLAKRLHGAPAAFTEGDSDDKPLDPEIWEWGHAWPQLTQVLDRLHFGEVAPEPVGIPFFLVVAMRLDPALVSAAEPSPSYELPLRAAPELETLFHDTQGGELSKRVGEFLRPEVAAALGLSATQQAVFSGTLTGLQNDLQAAGNNADARVEGYRTAVKKLHDAMPEATYSRLMEFISREAARMLMSQARR
jgi:hypothetical protein